jgi:hypothetical protein
MSLLKRGLVILFALSALALMTTSATAQMLNPDKTIFSISEPIDVGGTRVEPGTYLLRVVNLPDSRDMLQVTSTDGMTVIATVLSTPHERKVDSGVNLPTKLIYEPRPNGAPKVLLTWFPSNTSYGHDLIPRKGPVEELQTTIAEKAPEPLPEPVPETIVAEAIPAPAPAAQLPDVLPKTASRVPLMAALGLAAIGAALALKRIRA